MLAALNANKSQPTLFSPAKAMNALTIGAAHESAVFNGRLPANLVDPFADECLPNTVSTMAPGYRKAVKPDLLLEGGRMPVRVVRFGGSISVAPADWPAHLFGVKAAAPDPRGSTQHENYACKTSVARRSRPAPATGFFVRS